MNTYDNILDYDDELLNPEGEQYFLFKSGGDMYALKALEVSEILENQSVTKVPKCQDYVIGIVNIRGSLVGIIDLLKRLGIGYTQPDSRTSIVIVTVEKEDKRYQIGILIDEIFEVDGLDQDSIIQTPTFGTKISARFIKNMARYNHKEVCILDAQEVLQIDELAFRNEESA
jgi:purine-binding chemotaxis protein CheW